MKGDVNYLSSSLRFFQAVDFKSLIMEKCESVQMTTKIKSFH